MVLDGWARVWSCGQGVGSVGLYLSWPGEKFNMGKNLQKIAVAFFMV